MKDMASYRAIVDVKLGSLHGVVMGSLGMGTPYASDNVMNLLTQESTYDAALRASKQKNTIKLKQFGINSRTAS